MHGAPVLNSSRSETSGFNGHSDGRFSGESGDSTAVLITESSLAESSLNYYITLTVNLFTVIELRFTIDLYDDSTT
jgi:hypothetical protein